MAEQIVKETLVFQGNVISVSEIRVLLEDGSIVEWEVVTKAGDSVAMVAIDADNNVHLIEEYYGAVDKRLLSLPKGTVERNESPSQSALRELREEIGYTGILHDLITVEVSPSYLRQKTHIFLVTDLVFSPLEGDESAHIQEVCIPLKDVREMIANGHISEARTVAGLLLVLERLGL